MSKAFTLIELLVVVLIIGILSAIALPQYTKAVEKSRTAEAMQMAASIRTGVDAYLLANDYKSIELVGAGGAANLLDIDVEGVLDCTQDDGDSCCSKYFCYDAYCSTDVCYVVAHRYPNGNIDNSEQYYLSWLKQKSTGQWEKDECWSDDSDLSNSICTSFNAQ